MTELTGTDVSIGSYKKVNGIRTSIGDGLLSIGKETTALLLSVVGVATEVVAGLLGG